MADEAVATQEVPLSEATSQAAYKAARKEGKSVIAVEKTVEVEEPEKKEPEAEQEPEAAEEKPKVRGGFQKKIDKLTKERAEWEARATAAERRAQELAEKGGKEAPKNADPDPEPQEADFTDVREYWKSIGRWTARQEFKAQEEEKDLKETQELVNSINEAHQSRIEEAKEKYDDFDEKVNATQTPWNADKPTIIDRECFSAFYKAVKEDENSGELLYYYAEHPDDLEKLGELTPGQIGKAVGRVSDKITAGIEKEAPKPKLVSKAPPPIHPVSTGASKSSLALDQMESMAEYKKARKAGQKY